MLKSASTNLQFISELIIMGRANPHHLLNNALLIHFCYSRRLLTHIHLFHENNLSHSRHLYRMDNLYHYC